jgi:hypothetical protein
MQTKSLRRYNAYCNIKYQYSDKQIKQQLQEQIFKLTDGLTGISILSINSKYSQKTCKIQIVISINCYLI